MSKRNICTLLCEQMRPDINGIPCTKGQNFARNFLKPFLALQGSLKDSVLHCIGL